MNPVHICYSRLQEQLINSNSGRIEHHSYTSNKCLWWNVVSELGSDCYVISVRPEAHLVMHLEIIVQQKQRLQKEANKETIKEKEVHRSVNEETDCQQGD